VRARLAEHGEPALAGPARAWFDEQGLADPARVVDALAPARKKIT
jgi:hypothetical protein